MEWIFARRAMQGSYRSLGRVAVVLRVINEGDSGIPGFIIEIELLCAGISESCLVLIAHSTIYCLIEDWLWVLLIKMFISDILHKVRPNLKLNFLREVLLVQEVELFGLSKLGWHHLAEELPKLTSLNIPILNLLLHLVLEIGNLIPRRFFRNEWWGWWLEWRPILNLGYPIPRYLCHPLFLKIWLIKVQGS